MKKFGLLVLLMAAFAAIAVAQPRAIGGRIGYGFEVSYQHGLGESNMVNIDLGLPGFGGVEAAATYDWINPGGLTIPWNEQGSWNWYAGVGAGAGFYGFYAPIGFVGAAGRIGIEYNFWFPLQLSLDYRPVIGASFSGYGAGFNDKGLYAGGIALGVRYLF